MENATERQDAPHGAQTGLDCALAVLDAAPLACVLWNDTPQALDCNAECLALLGLRDKSECAGLPARLPATQPGGGDSAQFLRTHIAEAFRTGVSQFAFTLLNAGGESFACEVKVARVRRPGQGYAAMFLQRSAARREPAGAVPCAAEGNPARGAEDVFSGKTMLLADDVAVNRVVMTALLEDTGVVVECAADGNEAVEKFRAHPGRYDIIFMDLNMPGADGFAAAESIRAIGTLRAMAVPIIAMTANVFEDDIRRCIAAGMNGHIAKPAEREQVLAVLAKHLL